MMIKDHKFWVGVVVGVIAYYVYANHVRKGLGGGGAWPMARPRKTRETLFSI